MTYMRIYDFGHLALRGHTWWRYLEQAVGAHGAVGGAVALGGGPVPQAVAPAPQHVEALGVPDVRLQPHVLALPPVELQQQVAVATAGLAALALGLLLLLGARLETLLSLQGGGGREEGEDEGGR